MLVNLKEILEIAQKEMELSNMYDYIITNNKIDTSTEKLKLIIENEKNKN